MSTESITMTGINQETVVALSRDNNEPQWMYELRLAAWETYTALPMPTLRDEEWRRTNIRPIAAQMDTLRMVTPVQSTQVPSEWLPSAEALQMRGGALIQHNTQSVYVRVPDELSAQGVIFTDMNTALREHGDLVRTYFMTSAVTPSYSKFAALNGAFWQGGTFLYVPDNTHIALPLQSSFWMTESGCGLFPHSIVVVGRNSTVTLIEETGSQAAQGSLNSPVVELVLQQGANLRFISLQEFDESPNQIGVHRAILEQDATLTWVTATLGGKLAKLNIDTELRGSGTRAEVLGMYFASGNEILDFHTLQDHIAPNANSDLLFKGILKDKARTIFSGLIKVHEGAQKTDAYQKNNNLMLSSEARADSIPNLEIAANDVRCSHGATAGRVADDQLFYLMSRGLSKREAEQLIAIGFLTPLIERVPLEDLRQRLYALVEKTMEG